jgi:hypothetical protein
MKLKLILVASALLIGSQARANMYEITFTQTDGPTTAIGQIDVVGGYAVSGYLDVTGGAGIGTYDLASSVGSTPTNAPSGIFNYTSDVYIGLDPFLPSWGGLLWAAGTDEMNMWSNGDGSYSLWGNIGGGYNPSAIGTATLSAVPESGATIAMLGGVLLCLAALRRRFVS